MRRLYKLNRERFYLSLFFTLLFVKVNADTNESVKDTLINKFTHLDTIVLTHLTSKQNPAVEFSTVSLNKTFYFTRTTGLEETETLIYSMDVNTYIIDSICLKQKKKNLVPYARRFAISDKYLAISGHEEFSVYEKNPNTDQFEFLLRESRPHYYDLTILGDEIRFTYCYNYYRDDDKCGYGIYDVKKRKWASEQKLSMNGIYFTHFTPSKFVTFNDDKVLSLDPVNYYIYLYSSNGERIDSFSRNKANWTPLDLRVQKRLNENLPILPGKDVISYVNRHRLIIDRCQQILTLSKDTFLVSYYQYDSSLKDIQYFIDYYILSSDEIQLLKSDIIDVKSNDPELITNSEFPSMHTFNAHLFLNNNLVVIKNVVPLNYSGKSVKEIAEIENEYFKANDGVLGVYIFRLVL